MDTNHPHNNDSLPALPAAAASALEEEFDLQDEGDDIISNRPDSGQSSGSSVAVNCPTMPTEVIVHGRKVQKVRVLFTPHPPRYSTTASSVESLLSHRRHDSRGARHSTNWNSHRQGTPRARSESRTAMQVSEESSTTPVPFSQEESSSSTMFEYPSSQSNLSNSHTLVSHEGASLEHYHHQGMDRKIRQDILNGLNYLEKRKEELVVANQRLRLDLDELNRSNGLLLEEIAENKAKYEKLEIENDELKQKLDSNEKEIARLGNQALNEWNTRIKLEESFVEMRRSKEIKEEEIRSLMNELNEKNLELKQMESTFNNNNRKSRNDNDISEKFEHLSKVASLEDTIRRMQAENVKVNELAAKLESEVTEWKNKFEAKSQELDSQMVRFQALLRDVNELSAEKKKLAKSQIRGIQTNHVLTQAANSAGGNGQSETIKIIDLPDSSLKPMSGSIYSCNSRAGNGTRDSQRIQTAFQQHRKKSHDSSCSDSTSISMLLPPVSRLIHK